MCTLKAGIPQEILNPWLMLYSLLGTDLSLEGFKNQRCIKSHGKKPLKLFALSSGLSRKSISVISADSNSDW